MLEGPALCYFTFIENQEVERDATTKIGQKKKKIRVLGPAATDAPREI